MFRRGADTVPTLRRDKDKLIMKYPKTESEINYFETT